MSNPGVQTEGKTITNMGLTIHYTLSLKEDVSLDVVCELVRRTALYARKIGCAKVSPLLRAEKCEGLAPLYFSPRQSKGSFLTWVEPECGWLAQVSPGAGCETAQFGLCQYPRRSPGVIRESVVGTPRRGVRLRLSGNESAKDVSAKRPYREVANAFPFPGRISHASTGFRGGWYLHSSCKTQYAGRHGWENFLQCHLRVISLLDFWRSLGVRVRVNDEGGFWKARSVDKLRDGLQSYDGLVAAMSGVLKDAAGGASVKAPIFDYQSFERLEHQGWQEFGDRIERLRETLSHLKGQDEGR